MCQHCDEIRHRLIAAELAGNERAAEVQRRLLKQCREKYHPARKGMIIVRMENGNAN